MAKAAYGRWKVHNELGRGGQGRVIRVTDIQGEHQGDFALKLLTHRDSAQRTERFLREIRALQDLNHPNIVRVVDASDDSVENSCWFVMPLARNGSMADRPSMAKNDFALTLSIAVQAADALRAAHAQRIIHRDVKPENILFNEMSDVISLADFGLCHEVGGDRITDVGEVVGPRAFMAPEMEMGGDVEFDQSADVYSLGKLIFYLISGGRYLPRERLDEPEYKSDIPAGLTGDKLRSLLRRMIAAPESRISSMDDVLSELARIRRGIGQPETKSLPPRLLAKLDAGRARAEQKAIEDGLNLRHQQQIEGRIADVATSCSTFIADKLQSIADRVYSDVHEVMIAAGSNLFPGGVAENSNVDLGYREIAGMEITFRDRTKVITDTHNLRFSICRPTMSTHYPRENRRETTLQPQLIIMAIYYRRDSRNPGFREFGYLTWKKDWQKRHNTPEAINRRLNYPDMHVDQSPITGERSWSSEGVQIKFKPDEWPDAAAKLDEIVNYAAEYFVDKLPL